MNVRTALLVAGGVVGAAYFYSRSRGAAYGSQGDPLVVGPGRNTPTRSPGGGIFDAGGLFSVNSQLAISEQADRVGGTVLCTYYVGGAAAPACAKAAGVVSKVNAWQTKKTLQVAKGVVTDTYDQSKRVYRDVSSGNVVSAVKDASLAPIKVVGGALNKVAPWNW